MRLCLLISLLCAACGGGTEDNGGTVGGPEVTSDGALNVCGELIDIRDVAKDSVFPICDTYHYNESLPTELSQLKCAVSVKEMRGVERFACSETRGVYLGTTAPIEAVGWSDTGKRFTVTNGEGGLDIEYMLYRYKINEPSTWIDVPVVKDQYASTLLFAKDIIVRDTEQYGTLIAKADQLRAHNIANPSIIILPNGDLLAACTGALRDTTGKGAWVSFFASTDGGESWQVRSKGQITMSYQSTFLHKGVLYIMGTDKPAGNVVIHASYDNGYSWTDATDDKNGLLVEGEFHSAPVPVAIWNGRVWRGMETNETNKKVFVMSAPVDANLLDASSWTMSNMIIYDKSWAINGENLTGSEMIEGNVVVTPDNKLVDILRVSEKRYSRSIAMVNVENSKKISFDPSTGFYQLPGGGKKFTIRYDETTGKYWTITNPADQSLYGKVAEGYYSNGIRADLLRNRMVLYSSIDLKNWTEERVIMAVDEPFFHGFQYVDWQFDGDDIVSVIRMAAPEERGLPNRQHDANMLSFKRIENFRTKQ